MSERVPEKVIITGSTGLVGSEAVEFYAKKGATVFGIDNNMRAHFFGPDGSTEWRKKELEQKLDGQYIHISADIRDDRAIYKAFLKAGKVDLVVHCASQPAHDWAATDPRTDFGVNAEGTLNMLETYRQMSPAATFIHCSTSKVYGDNPNRLPLIEQDTRYDLPTEHPYFQGITEDFSIDHALHSLFGASKVAADVIAQEYGRYFDLPVAIFRPVCISGRNHSGAELHGFLSYLAKCIATDRNYNIYGYKGKQVRGNIHSFDLVQAFDQYYQNPHTRGQAYNIDGGRAGSVSVLEAGMRFSQLLDKPFRSTYVDEERIGDHQWCVFSNAKFQTDFPDWKPTYDADKLMQDIAQGGHFGT